MKDRTAIVALLLFAAAIVTWRWTWLFWGRIVTNWGDLSVRAEWLDPAMLLLWLLLLALSLVFGLLLVLLGHPARPGAIATLAGALLGLVLFLGVRNYFTSHATASSYVWTYGLYALAPVGSLIGAEFAARIKRGRAAGLLSNNRLSGRDA